MQTDDIKIILGEGSGHGIMGRALEGIAIYSVGFSFRMNGQISIQVESANRMMNSDKMDGWVNGYPYDFYNYTSVGFVYRFWFDNKRIVPYQLARNRFK